MRLAALDILKELPGLWQPVYLTTLLSEKTKIYLKSQMINKFNLVITNSPHKMSVENLADRIVAI